MDIINREMTFGTRQSNAVHSFNAYAYLVDLSWLVWKFNKTQNVPSSFSLLPRAVVQGCVCVCRVFQVIEISYGPVFAFFFCLLVYYVWYAYLFMHWNIEKKKLFC